MPVIVQRIVVDWGKDARGAREASLRRDIPRALDLPPLPDAPLAVHEIVAREHTGYTPVVTTAGHDLPAQLNGLRFRPKGAAVEVLRTPVRSSYPRNRHPGRVFMLQPGDRVRYRANFRFSGYSTDWYYEEWTLNIACVPWRAELFMDGEFDGEKDERVSLYGGP